MLRYKNYLLQVDDLQKSTDDVPHIIDVPVVTVPRVDDQTNNDANQNANNPTVSYMAT